MAMVKYKYPKGRKIRYQVRSRKISGGMLEFRSKKMATKFNRLIKKGY